jgi:hypothetical protein
MLSFPSATNASIRQSPDGWSIHREAISRLRHSAMIASLERLPDRRGGPFNSRLTYHNRYQWVCPAIAASGKAIFGL